MRELYQFCTVASILLYKVEGIKLPQCQSNVTEINMASSTNQIRCEGAGVSETIQWDYTDGGSNTGSLTCDTFGNCSGRKILFTATRTRSSTFSTLTLQQDVKTFRTVYGAMTLTCSSVNTQNNNIISQTSCQLDVVHASEVTSCNARFNTAPGTSWTVSGSCDVSKVFSQRGLYSCQWKEHFSGSSTEVTSSVNLTGSSAEGGVTYRSMTCTFEKPLPRVTGSYAYTVVLSPGAVKPDVTFAGSSDIALPTARTSCPGDYVREGDDVDCTCNSTNGNPDGSAVWSSQPRSSRLTLPDVKRGHHGNSYVCEVRWGSEVVSNATFTLQVAYGPDTVSINGQAQPFDTDGNQSMTLTCNVGPSGPKVNYQWSGQPAGSVVNSNQLTLNNVGRADDGAEIECTAVNTKFSAVLRASTSLTLDLHYPPLNAPVIRNTSGQSFVNQGDPLTLTCSVTGGKPVNATTLTFTCPDKDDREDVHSSTEVSSSVTFDSVVASDNGDVCTCRGRWKTYNDWYTLQDSATIVVYYAPTKPNISTKSQPYPFLAGESPTLYCIYPPGADPGNPTATLTLNGQAGGRGQGEVNVTLGELSSADNGRRVVCEASNAFTDLTNTPVTRDLLLQVYYPPVIGVTSLPSDSCSLMTSSSSVICVVMEGQRVRVNCTALHSNPSIATIAWQPDGGSVLDLPADREMNMDYTCDVTTVSLGGTDTRLPLRNSTTLTVLVKYRAEVSGLTVNEETVNKTVVNEGDTITVNCTARGRPTARILLTKDGRVVAHRAVGDVSRDDVVVLYNTTDRAHCEDAGFYACQADNRLGDPDQHSVSVFVNCRPRLSNRNKIPGIINYEGGGKTVGFDLTTFPVPENYTLHFTGLADNLTGQDRETARDDMYDVKCAPINDVPTTSTNCTLTILSATERDKGFYTLTLENQWGRESIKFQLDINRTVSEKGTTGGHSFAGPIGGGVGAGVAVLAVLAVVIIFIRRKQGKKEDARAQRSLWQHGHHAEADEPEMIVNEIYGTAENENKAFEQSDTPQVNAYEDVDLRSTEQLPTAGLPVNAKEPVTRQTDEMYTSVKKGKRPTEASATNESINDVYSTANKTKKLKPPVKEKPKKKTVPEGKLGKGKQSREESSDYTNMMPLSMNPPQTQCTVYENFAFQEDECRQKNDTVDKEGKFQMTNSDGLVYTTVAFTDEQMKKAEAPPPQRETTEYVDIDFTKTSRTLH